MDLKTWRNFGFLEQEFISTIKMAFVFGSTGKEVLIVTKDDKVLAFGSNENGCLGLGNSKGTDVPTQIEALCGKKVVGFSSGHGPYVLAYTEGGEVYTWGCNNRGQLGNGLSNACSDPIKVNNLSEQVVVKVACGKSFSLALTKEGKVFTWGEKHEVLPPNHTSMSGKVSKERNVFGAGIGRTSLFNEPFIPYHTSSSSPEEEDDVPEEEDDVPDVKKINLPEMVHSELKYKKCVSIACGENSSFAVTDTGEVYAWGFNDIGQLGLGDRVERENPCRVRVSCCNKVIVTRVVCGSSHTLALTDLGALYAWGANYSGQLGTGDQKNALSPVLVATKIGRIVDVAATHSSCISAAITWNLKVYVWGSCSGKTILLPVVTAFSSLHDVFAYMATPSVTWKPIHFEEHVSERVTDSLRQAFDDSNTSDLIIKVEDKPIYVHKGILKIRCQSFRSMFDEHWQGDNEGVMNIKEYSYTAYRAFLQYLYTEEVSLSPESCLELLKLANAIREMKLKNRCEELIGQGITVQNALKLYLSAIEYEAKELEDLCLKFILDHMTEIALSDRFSEINGETLKDIIRKGANSGELKKGFLEKQSQISSLPQ